MSNSGGMQTLVPLRSRPELIRQFIPYAPDVLGNVRNVLSVLRPPSEGEAIDSAIHWVASNRASNDIQVSF